MGFSYTLGNADTAPDWCCNATGSPRWSGKKESEFDNELVMSIIDFCQSEAHRRGWGACGNDEIDLEKSNIFHSKFLFGIPFHAWRINYIQGAYNYAEEYGVKLERFNLVGDIPLVESSVRELKRHYDLPDLEEGVPALRRCTTPDKEKWANYIDPDTHDWEEFEAMIAAEFEGEEYDDEDIGYEPDSYRLVMESKNRTAIVKIEIDVMAAIAVRNLQLGHSDSRELQYILGCSAMEANNYYDLLSSPYKTKLFNDVKTSIRALNEPGFEAELRLAIRRERLIEIQYEKATYGDQVNINAL